jgi:hypothetical protein
VTILSNELSSICSVLINLNILYLVVEVFMQIGRSRVDFLCSKMSLDMRTVYVFLTEKEVE